MDEGLKILVSLAGFSAGSAGQAGRLGLAGRSHCPESPGPLKWDLAALHCGKISGFPSLSVSSEFQGP